MNRSLRIAGVLAALALAWATGLTQGQTESTSHAVIFTSADKAKFKETRPGVSMAVLWGDPDKGPYGAFTKFAPGFDAGMHTHTNDVWLVAAQRRISVQRRGG